MSAVEAPVRRLSLAQWDERYGRREGVRTELVRGRVVMTPNEAGHNIRAALRLVRLMEDAFSPDWTPLTNFGVLLAEDPAPTLRQPDLVLVRSEAVGRDWYVLPSQVALVVEVVSPSSVERDWVTKRDEYAAAGIPAYLVVDLRAGSPRIYLFDTRAGADAADGYADPEGDGNAVTLDIGGRRVTVTATDLAS